MADAPTDAERRPHVAFHFDLVATPANHRATLLPNRPRHLVLPLAVLGGAASAVGLLTAYGAGSEHHQAGGRCWPASWAAGIFGIVNLYVLRRRHRLGRRGRWEAWPRLIAVRAVFAWGILPSILGLAVVLSIAAGWRIFAGGVSAEPRSLRRLLGDLCKRRMRALGDGLDPADAVAGRAVWLLADDRGLRRRHAGAGGRALALIVRTFLFHPFNFPAASMIADLAAWATISSRRNTPMATPAIRCRSRRRCFRGASSAPIPRAAM